MTKHQILVDYASKIRTLARDPDTDWKFRDHSLDEMAKDGIDLVDAYFVIKAGRVSDMRLEKGEWRYTVEGKNVDGIKMAFPIVFSTEQKLIEIVTAFLIKK